MLELQFPEPSTYAHSPGEGTARGQLSPEVYEAKKKARLSLQERCRQNELEFVETLEHIAKYSTNDNARISAIGMIFDRAQRKAMQPHDVGMGGAIQLVITGVPEPDEPREA
jgi:hypothetical protein